MELPMEEIPPAYISKLDLTSIYFWMAGPD